MADTSPAETTASYRNMAAPIEQEPMRPGHGDPCSVRPKMGGACRVRAPGTRRKYIPAGSTAASPRPTVPV